ncbi:hypothetical protein [Achromobacter phage Motura]|uniref:Uncharacterized protein n=1 Tax=Achromobacter phage Motura TaxID=2591403 RepID=A0A514CTB3_9CAUD|nr:hypothetical protein H1O15_gp115 [Achromobacter phage Motura]QDH83712.1 hypothetical protein [Achromobacter phage Motura]
MITGITASFYNSAPPPVWDTLTGSFPAVSQIEGDTDGILRVIGIQSSNYALWESSDEGQNWTSTLLGTTSSAACFALTATNVVVLSPPATRARYKAKTQGGTFATGSPEPVLPYLNSNWMFNTGTLLGFVATNTSTNRIVGYTSPTGATWTAAGSFPIGFSAGRSNYGGGYAYVHCTGSSTYYFSANLSSWTQGALQASIVANNGYPVYSSTTNMMYMVDATNGNVYGAAPGANFMPLVATGTPFRSAFTVNGKIYGRSVDSTVLLVTKDFSTINEYPAIPSSLVTHATEMGGNLYLGSGAAGVLYKMPILY